MTIYYSTFDQVMEYYERQQKKKEELDKRGDPRFKKILDHLWELHCQKSADYGTDEDRYANLRAATEFNVPSWIGVAVRANDKMSRIKTFAKKQGLQCEPLTDSFRDLASYAILAWILFEEGFETK